MFILLFVIIDMYKLKKFIERKGRYRILKEF